MDIWVQTWAAIDETEKKETRKSWNKTLSSIPQGGAIKATKGPVEATVMALMGLGWKPAAPDQWLLPQGDNIKLDGEAFTRFQITARAHEDAQRKSGRKQQSTSMEEV